MIENLKIIYRWIRNFKNRLIFNIRYSMANEIVDIPCEEAFHKLNEIAPMPTSTAIVQHEVRNTLYDLVIIVPAYNAEKWIRQCIDSILEQETEYHFLTIVIDDGSKDNTGNILDSYLPNERLKVIHQENKGYSGARNAALKKLCSKYIMFVDSDDYLLPGAVECLLKKAYQEDADIVEGNGYCFDETGILGKIKKDNTYLWGGPCLKVMKSTLFECVEFPEGYLYEDTIINALIKSMASKMVLLPDEIYAYRIHAGSITQKHDQNVKRVDSIWIMFLMEENRRELGLYENRKLDEVLQHIEFTYRRTRELQEDVKKLIFAVTCGFIRHYYVVTEMDKKDELLNSLLTMNYGKYKVVCEFNQ